MLHTQLHGKINSLPEMRMHVWIFSGRVIRYIDNNYVTCFALSTNINTIYTNPSRKHFVVGSSGAWKLEFVMFVRCVVASWIKYTNFSAVTHSPLKTGAETEKWEKIDSKIVL